MRKPVSICAFLIFLLAAIGTDQSVMATPVQQSPQEDYLIMNGKLWRNLYLGVKGNPYFMSGDYLRGDIYFNGRLFMDRTFKYDIYNDEIVLWINSSTIIILNKEMVKEFNINYPGDRFHVVNMGEDSTSVLSGFVNVYYEGPTALYVKYRKEIEILAVDNKYDLFIQVHRIFIRKDNQIVQVSGKRELLKILSDRKAELKSYIKHNKLRVAKNEPRSFIPVLEYYDKLRQ
ncbi:MAG: hypothetical protein V1903_02940 [Bacteroidota bacterium]